MQGGADRRAVRNATLVSERGFLQAIIELAQLRGWKVCHFRPALNRRGRWHTPIQGEAGFPDLVLCRPPRLLLVELKAQDGRLTPAQRAWMEALRACDGVEVYLWRPSDWHTIQAILSSAE